MFGTALGNLHLYSSNFESCRFNQNSIPTEFASDLADGLRVADLDVNPEEDYELPVSGSYALAKAAGKAKSHCLINCYTKHFKMKLLLFKAILVSTAASTGAIYKILDVFQQRCLTSF